VVAVRALRLLPVVALAGLFVGGPVAPPAAAQAAPHGETIVDFDYAPRTTTVDVGATVRWTNTGARPHTATDRGGAFDTGVLVPPGDHSALADAVVSLLEDEPRRRTLGEAARELARERYAWETIAERLAGVYELVTGIRRPRPAVVP
jgi:plastocyanin